MIGVLIRDFKVGGTVSAKSSGAFAQVDAKDTAKLVQASTAVVEAAGFSASDNERLSALVQSQQGSDDDSMGAPDAAGYKSRVGGIVDALVDLEEKAEGELSDMRKTVGNAKHTFYMLAQSRMILSRQAALT